MGVGVSVRLLIIAPESYPVPSAQGTSVETCIYNLAANLAKHHLVTVVSRSVQYLSHVTTCGNLRILRVVGGTKTKYITRVLEAVAGQSFDQIQVDNRPSFLATVRKQFPKTPLSIFLHSLTFVTPPKTSIGRACSQLAVADLVVVNSESLKSRVSALCPSQGLNIKVVHLGVTVSKFRPPTNLERTLARAKYRLEGSFAIVYAGRIIPLKGVPLLIKAADLAHQEIPSAKLLLAGSGKKTYVSYVKALANRANVPVKFTGNVPWQKMQQVYWTADCFVCPTQGHEAFGLVVAEALATGVPTVASHNGGIQEIITHGVNGLLVIDFDSPNEFAKAVVAIAKNSALSKRLGEQGRITCVSRFTWQNASETLQRLYFGGESTWKKRRS